MAGGIEHFHKEGDGWLKSRRVQSRADRLGPSRQGECTVDESQAQGFNSYKEQWVEKTK